MNTIAKDIMSNRVIVATEGMSMEEAVKILVNNKITGLPVVDVNGVMIGILSEYDIISHVVSEKNLEPQVFNKDIKFTKIVESVKEDTPLNEILERFVNKKIRRLPVLDQENRLVGMISRRDVMRVLYYRAKVG